MTVLSLDELNRCVKLFGDSQKAFMRCERRALLRSVLFDVPRRSSLGWHCFYEKAPSFLRRLVKKVSPEEVGQRMKRLCSRPYYLQLSIIMCSYFGARQQLLLDRGLAPGQAFPEERVEDATSVVDFWRRACQAYRNDGLLLPDQSGHTQPILPPFAVEPLNAQLQATSPSDRKRLRRMVATLELYSFILHGEQRDGLFAHGPYDLGQERQIVVLEYTDLQNDYLPWARTETRNPYPHLALALRLKGVRTRFDLFGGVLFDPRDIAPHVEAEGIFARTADDSVLPISLSEAEKITACAAAAQNELYLKAAEWSPRFKAEYGVHLFANHLRSFFQLVSSTTEVDECIRSEFQASADGLLDSLLARAEPPSIWNFMATTEGEFFWPIAPIKG